MNSIWLLLEASILHIPLIPASTLTPSPPFKVRNLCYNSSPIKINYLPAEGKKSAAETVNDVLNLLQKF